MTVDVDHVASISVDRPASRASIESLSSTGLGGTSQRLSPQRPSSNGALSISSRLALDEAARRASVILAEGGGKPAAEIQRQLSRIVGGLPTLAAAESANGDREAVDVPRRYSDVLRGELLATLSSQSETLDSAEVVAVFTALEVALRCSETTSTGRFVSRLSGAESMNAVVEIAHDIRSPLSS